MKWSRTLIPTLRDDPQEAEIPSHRLMLRAGLIKKLASGLYTWLPLGFRVLKKVEEIVREEMDRAGAIEILMPILQPRALWEASGRWETMEEIMLLARSHSGRELVLGPTHEEVVTDLVAHEINSYRQLPKNIYQINTKFRDEIRPRFGVMRSREFIMKDAYSFDVDGAAADRSYEAMYEAYRTIFARCGLSAMAVEADTGVMGGQRSHEFMVPAASGEDGIVCCDACGYAANAEQAEMTPPEIGAERTAEALEEVDTPRQRTVEELCAFFATTPDRFIKTLIYLKGEEPVAVLIRGDREVNEIKLAKILGGAVELAGDEAVRAATGAPIGFAGPVGLKGIRIIADRTLNTVVSGITGANRADRHLKNVNIDRDCQVGEYYDLALVGAGDACPRCGRPLQLRRGIEVGHVFKLGTKYSRAMGALYKDENGDDRPCVMGCFGIGVSRTVAAVVEQCSDESGIVWPVSIAPYQVHIVLLGGGDEGLDRVAAEAHDLLEAGGVEALLDDRDAAAGVKFNDADLIGIPLRVTVGRKFLKTGLLEVKPRR
ncbi:MAG TPA: proline--tRNA ligase, partial [bacterium]|nr:proline--tRNA ligase [bacterium]